MRQLTKADWVELSRRARAGDLDARNQIVEANLGLADKALALFPWIRPADEEDMRQEARIALCAAATTFDPAAGCRFSTYAIQCMRHALLHARAHTGIVRVPYGYANGSKRGVPHQEDAQRALSGRWKDIITAGVPDSSVTDPGEMYDAREQLVGLYSAVEALPPRLGDLMQRLLAGESCEEASRQLGMTRDRAHADRRLALDMIRLRLGIVPIHYPVSRVLATAG